MSNEINTLYEFRQFRLDTKERVLIRQNETIILAPKVFDTLEVLIKSGGKIVSKDDLMNAIWEDSFVEEGNLTQNIYILRQMLGKEFIETVPRRGYRFAAEVNTVELEKVFGKNETNDNQVFGNDQHLSEVIVATKTKTYLSEEIIEESFEPMPTAETGKFPVNKRNPNKLLVGAIVGIFSVLAITALGFWMWSNPKTDASQNSANSLEFKSLTDTGDIISSAISPDGKFLAFIKDEKSLDRTIWLKDIELDQEVKLDLAKDSYPSFLQFSANGENIYMYARPAMDQSGEIHVIGRFGGNIRLVAKDVWSKFGLSKDDKLLAFIRKNPATNDYHLIVKNLENNDEKALTTQNFPESFEVRYARPAFSPDSKNILAVSEPQRKFVSNLLVVDAENGTTKKLETPKLRQIYQAVYKTEDEIILAAQEGKELPQIYKLSILSGELQRITNDLNAYMKISLAGNGETLVVTKTKMMANVWFIPDADTKKARQLTFEKEGSFDGIYGLNTLPDEKIIYVSLADKNRNFWTVDPQNGEKRQLTKDKGDANEHPFISLKSSHIYYDSTEDGNRTVQRMDFDGQNSIKITSGENANDLFPVLSNDESILYFIRQAKGVSAIWKKNMPDGQPEKLEVSEKITPVGFLKISPDGKFLMFRQATKNNEPDTPAKTYEVGIISIKTDKAEPTFVEIPSMNIVVRWAGTSDALDYFDQTDLGVVIWRKNVFNQNQRRQIAELPNMHIYNFCWFRNDKDLVVSEGKSMDDAVLITNF